MSAPEAALRLEHPSSFVRRLVADVMTPGVVSAHEGATFRQIAAAMARNRVSTVPVLDSDRRVVGVVTASDLLTRISGDHGPAPRGHRLAAEQENRRKQHALLAAELMTWPAVTTTELTSIPVAAQAAAHHRVRSLPVVRDDDGVLVGIVTKSDLIKVFLREDAAIRHEIEKDIVEELVPLDQTTVDVAVHEGVVTLTGRVDHRSIVEQLVASTRGIPGVVYVFDEMAYRVDDTLGRSSSPDEVDAVRTVR